MSGGSTGVRRIGRDDLALSRRIRLAALADAPDAFAATLEQERAMPESAWRARVESNAEGLASAGWFALVDGEEQGMVVGVYHPGDPPAVALNAMWVAPAARGRGAGEALVEAVVGWARERGVDRVGLSVREGNAPAIGLYERCGFERVAERPAFLEATAACEVHMVRELDDPTVPGRGVAAE